MDDDFVCPVRMLHLGISASELVEIVDNDDNQISFKLHWPHGKVEVMGREKLKGVYTVATALPIVPKPKMPRVFPRSSLVG